MKAHEFDERFDQGEDVDDHIEWSQACRPNLATTSVEVALPAWMLENLDKEAEKLGVTREALIKFWLSERMSG